MVRDGFGLALAPPSSKSTVPALSSCCAIASASRFSNGPSEACVHGPLIELDVRSKRIDAQPFALLFDRLHVMLGEKQRYGTQLGNNLEGELLLMPLEDRGRVEELRKELGLIPLAEYLRFFEKQNGGKPIRSASDD